MKKAFLDAKRKIFSGTGRAAKMVRTAILSGAVLMAVCAAVSCKKADSRDVVIFTSTEDFRTEHIQQLLDGEFPDYNITIQVLSTGNHAARLRAEGTATEADIIINLETGYLEAVQDVLADISPFGYEDFLPELVPAHHRYLPWDKSSGAVVINRDRLAQSGLPVPANYRDLLNPRYRGLISMPNPKTSGTGYMFLVSLVNAWGEDAAFAYFDALAENILQFTTSGSGPVNALIQGEAAIGLGMTLTAVQAINSRGAPFDLLYFAEGAPGITTGMGIVSGRETRPAVKEVFAFVMDRVCRDDKELYCPEPVYRDQPNNIPNYPRNISYADMTGVYDIAWKETLLARWKY